MSSAPTHFRGRIYDNLLQTIGATPLVRLSRLAKAENVKAEIIGISKDNAASHGRFRQKYGLRFQLASDADTAVQQAYGVWIEKSLYGRKYMGTDRATFLIDKDGVIRGAWRGVKVDGHVAAVLAAAQAL